MRILTGDPPGSPQDVDEDRSSDSQSQSEYPIIIISTEGTDGGEQAARSWDRVRNKEDRPRSRDGLERSATCTHC